jgi:hypothetical protein
MRHLQVGKRTVRKTFASVAERQIGRQSFSDSGKNPKRDE